jgi:hypothetical protein
MQTNRITKRSLIYLLIPIGVFLLVVGFSAFTRKAAEASAAADSPAVAPEPRLDANLRTDMEHALTPESVLIPASLYNPFTDRIGVNKQPSTGIQQTLSLPAGLNGRLPSRLAPGMTPSGAPPAQQPTLKPYPDRFQEWQRQGRELRAQGQSVPPRSSIFSLTELKLTGSKGDGAWLLFKPEGRAFSAPSGTKFYDAELVRVIPRVGAVFQPLDKDGRAKGAPVTIPFSRDSK